MKIIINGALGKMGRCVEGLSLNLGHEVVFRADLPPAPAISDFSGEVDVIIDFSSPSATPKLLEYATARSLPVVIATTGQDRRQKSAVAAAAKKIPIFFSANLSVGIAALCRAANDITAYFNEADIEISETHHRDKRDAPGGTALLIAERLNMGAVYGRRGKRDKRIGLSSLRLGNIVGEHEVFIAQGDEILSVRHVALSRTVFAQGALKAAAFLLGKPCGLYDIFDL